MSTQQRINQLISAYRQSTSRNSELELELKNVRERGAEHERRANMMRQRILELEDLIQILDSKAKDAGKKVRESELLLGTNKYRIQELEQEISTLEKKCEDSEAESKKHSDKVSELEVALQMANEKESEAAKRAASVKEELDQISLKLACSESTNEELKRKISEAEDKAAQSFLKLKTKVDELQELLNSSYATPHQLASTITELTDQHSRPAELQSANEARISEAETQLQEAIQKFTVRDSEAKELNEKLNTLEGQVRMYEEQAHEASAVAEAQKVELEQTLLKLKEVESIVEELQTKSGNLEKEREGLATVNLKLTQELGTYEFKLNDLQTRLSAAFADKDEAVEQLHSSKKAIEDLTQQLTSEGQRLQSQISSVMEENNLLNETHQNAKKELQAVIIQLEGQLKELKSNEDALKAEIQSLKVEIGEKSVLQIRLKELEEQLAIAEA